MAGSESGLREKVTHHPPEEQPLVLHQRITGSPVSVQRKQESVVYRLLLDEREVYQAQRLLAARHLEVELSVWFQDFPPVPQNRQLLPYIEVFENMDSVYLVGVFFLEWQAAKVSVDIRDFVQVDVCEPFPELRTATEMQSYHFSPTAVGLCFFCTIFCADFNFFITCDGLCLAHSIPLWISPRYIS